MKGLRNTAFFHLSSVESVLCHGILNGGWFRSPSHRMKRQMEQVQVRLQLGTELESQSYSRTSGDMEQVWQIFVTVASEMWGLFVMQHCFSKADWYSGSVRNSNQPGNSEICVLPSCHIWFLLIPYVLFWLYFFQLLCKKCHLESNSSTINQNNHVLLFKQMSWNLPTLDSVNCIIVVSVVFPVSKKSPLNGKDPWQRNNVKLAIVNKVVGTTWWFLD